MKFNEHIDKDDKGREYKQIYGSKTDCDITMGDNVLVVKGTPKIVTRHGESEFGEQLLFQFLVDKSIPPEAWKRNTNHDTVEFYLPLEEGIMFLKQAIALFEKNKIGDINESK